MSDQELRDELVTVLLAGHETTGTALAWAFGSVLGAPEVLGRIRTELAEVVGKGRLERQHIPRLTYLDAVVSESLRYRPLMPNGGTRVVKKPFTLGGHLMPPGARLTKCMYLLHRRPDLHSEPGRFLPERFLEKKPDPYEWTPFGGGGRHCLGKAFAVHEMRVVLATVLSQVDLRLVEARMPPVRRGFFLAPRGGVRVVRSSA